MIEDIGLVYSFSLTELMSLRITRLRRFHARALARLARPLI